MVSKRKTPVNQIPAKKQKKEKVPPKVVEDEIDPYEEDLDRLASFINDAKARGYSVPGGDSNLQMLQEAGRLALKECVDERHKWQQQMVECIAEAMYGVRNGMETALSEMCHTRDNSDTIKANLEASKEQAEQNFQTKKNLLEEKKVVLAEKKDNLAVAEEELEKLEDDFQAAQNVLDELQSAHTLLLSNMDDLTKLKSESNEEAAKNVLAALNLYEAEDTILCAAPKAFEKSPESRGPFDQQIFNACDQFLVQHRDIVQAKVSEAQQVTNNATVAKDAAEMKKEKALDERVFATEDVENLAKEKTDANNHMKQCDKDISAHVRTSKEIGHNIKRLEGYLREFRLAIRLFELLQVRESKKPEPEVVEEPVVAEANVEEPVVEQPVEVPEIQQEIPAEVPQMDVEVPQVVMQY